MSTLTAAIQHWNSVTTGKTKVAESSASSAMT